MESSPNTFARKYARLRLGYEGKTRSLRYARADCASKVRGPGEATPHVSTDEVVQESGLLGDPTSNWSNADGRMGDSGSCREWGARLRGGEAIHGPRASRTLTERLPLTTQRPMRRPKRTSLRKLASARISQAMRERGARMLPLGSRRLHQRKPACSSEVVFTVHIAHPTAHAGNNLGQNAMVGVSVCCCRHSCLCALAACVG